jgi:hypothetical protein
MTTKARSGSFGEEDHDEDAPEAMAKDAPATAPPPEEPQPAPQPARRDDDDAASEAGPPARRVAFVLRSVCGLPPEEIELVSGSTVLLGRDSRADVRLVDRERKAAGKLSFVSRKHAKIRCVRRADGDAVYARALRRSDGSLARVYVDGATLEAESATRLRPGCRVVFGSMLDDSGAPYARFAYDLFAFGFDGDAKAARAVDLDVARAESDDESWHETYDDEADMAHAVSERAAYRRLEIDQIYDTAVDGRDDELAKRLEYQAFAYDDPDQVLDVGLCDAGCLALPGGFLG